MCPECQSHEWEAIELSGRGTLHAVVKPVHPPLPMFESGYLVALVELEEGIRLLSNLCGVALHEAKIGMPMEVFFIETESGEKVHQFRPVGDVLG